MEEKKKTTKKTAPKLVDVMEKLTSALELIQKQEDELNAYRKSNTLLEEELVRVRDANVSLGKANAKLQNELRDIKSRGFLARLFNR